METIKVIVLFIGYIGYCFTFAYMFGAYLSKINARWYIAIPLMIILVTINGLGVTIWIN